MFRKLRCRYQCTLASNVPGVLDNNGQITSPRVRPTNQVWLGSMRFEQ